MSLKPLAESGSNDSDNSQEAESFAAKMDAAAAGLVADTERSAARAQKMPQGGGTESGAGSKGGDRATLGEAKISPSTNGQGGADDLAVETAAVPVALLLQASRTEEIVGTNEKAGDLPDAVSAFDSSDYHLSTDYKGVGDSEGNTTAVVARGTSNAVSIGTLGGDEYQRWNLEQGLFSAPKGVSAPLSVGNEMFTAAVQATVEAELRKLKPVGSGLTGMHSAAENNEIHPGGHSGGRVYAHYHGSQRQRRLW